MCLTAHAQTFHVPRQYEETLRSIDTFEPLRYELFGENDVHDITSIGQIIENFIPPFTDPRKKAVYLNELGYSYYEKREYVIACHIFSYAFHVDGTYKYPAYNLACSEALDAERKPQSEYEMPEWYEVGGRGNRVVEYWLRKAIALDPDYKRKMRTDPDLAFYDKEPWFIALYGEGITTNSGIRAMLCNVEVWYGPKPGIYPQSPELCFYNNGTVTIKSFDMDRRGGSHWSVTEARYTIQNGGFTIVYDDKTVTRGYVRERKDEYGFSNYFLELENGLFFQTELDISA
jgi:hypothetical protein